MPRSEEQPRTTPTDGSDSSQSEQDRFPHLDLRGEADEDDQEGDITLTFIGPRPVGNPPPTTPTDESDADRFNPTSPHLVPDDEDDLAEGETVLTFLAPPPERDE